MEGSPSKPPSPSRRPCPNDLRVYRAVHRQTRGLAACKVINLYVNPAWGLGTPNIKELQKEVQVHKALKNPYILEFLHHETIKIDNPDHYTPGLYMLLELAVGGDLFDKIGTYNALSGLTNLTVVISTGRWRARRSCQVLLCPDGRWRGKFSCKDTLASTKLTALLGIHPRQRYRPPRP